MPQKLSSEVVRPAVTTCYDAYHILLDMSTLRDMLGMVCYTEHSVPSDTEDGLLSCATIDPVAQALSKERIA